MILRDRIESCLRVLDKYHYVQCTTALPSARCSCGLHLVKSSLRANWHQLEAERDALAADLAAARALLREAREFCPSKLMRRIDAVLAAQGEGK